MLNNHSLTSRCWLEKATLADLTRLANALWSTFLLYRCFSEGGGGWRTRWSLGVIDAVASSRSAVDVPPKARASNAWEVVQCKQGSRQVESELEELHTHVLDQGLCWINNDGQITPPEHKAHGEVADPHNATFTKTAAVAR